jgi:ABC-type nitrate/sulfonate/bicarbonate transport system substrate-binding protein
MLGVILLVQALTVAVSGPPTSIAYLPIRVAQAEGYFTRDGLAVVVRPVHGPVEAAVALLEGDADLAATSFETVARRASGEAGAKVRLVFGLTAAPPVALLAAKERLDPARSVAALARQRVAMAAPGPEGTWLGAILARARLDARRIRLESVGESELVRVIEAGEAAAGFVPEPFATQLLTGGRATLLADLRTPRAAAETLGTRTVDAAVFARTDRMPRSTALAAFTRALLAAEGRITATDAGVLGAGLPAAITARPDEFSARVAASRQLYLPDGTVSVDQVRASLALFKARQPLPAATRLATPRELLSAPAR